MVDLAGVLVRAASREPRATSAFTDTLISRAFRERIVLVGVTFPHGTLPTPKPGSTSWPCWWTRPAPTWSARVIQRRTAPDPATYLGRGKAEELPALCLEVDADTVVFDDDLSPAQQRNLEKILGRTAIDRTAVILDIFAQNARTPEGRGPGRAGPAALPAAAPAGPGHDRSANRPAASAPGARARPSSRSTAGAWSGA